MGGILITHALYANQHENIPIIGRQRPHNHFDFL